MVIPSMTAESTPQMICPSWLTLETSTNTTAVPSAICRGESCIRLDDCRRPNSGDHKDRPYTDHQPIPAQPGAYFVTICTRDRKCLFGHVVNEEMHLNDAGEVAQRCWEDIPRHFPLVELDAFVTMPNHVHGIIVITEFCRDEKNSPLPRYTPPRPHNRRRERSVPSFAGLRSV